MMVLETKTMTADELLRMSDDGVVHELLDGELRTMAPAGFEHGRIAALVCASLTAHVRQHRLGVVTGAETGFFLRRQPDTVRGADAAFVRRERVVDTERYFPGPPDLAIEIISPNDTYTEVNAKVVDWLSSGTQMVIVIDPAKKNAVVHRATRSVRIDVDGTLDAEEIVPGWRLPLRELLLD